MRQTHRTTWVVLATVFALSIVGNAEVSYAQHAALFVSNYRSQNVSVYPGKVNGTVLQPTRVISSPSMNGPHNITVNPKTRELIVSNNPGFSIDFYDGDLASPTFGSLKRSIVGADTGLAWPLDVTVDVVSQELFVSNDDHKNEPVNPHTPVYSITVYDLATLGSGGNVSPKRTITGPNTKLSSPAGMVVRHDPLMGDELFVVNYDYFSNNNGASVAVYPLKATGDVAPIRTIQGPQTGFDRPQGIVLDELNGRIYVSNSAFDEADLGNISAFNMLDTGNVAPLGVIKGDQTQMCHPFEMYLDGLMGELTVAQSGVCDTRVTVFSLNAGFSGNIAPIRKLVTGATQYYDPIGLTVIPNTQQSNMISNIGPVEATVAGGAPINFDPGFSTCSTEWGAVTPGAVFPLGTKTVQCVGTDIFGPISSSFTVTVQDTTPPVFNGVQNLVTEAISSTPVNFAVSATDRGELVPVTCTPASDSLFYVGTTVVNCSAYPSFGGPGASTSFTVKVNQTVPPLPGGACFVVDFREVTYFNGAAVITSSDADVRTKNGIAGAFNPALWPYRAAGGAGYTKSRGVLFRIYGFSAGSYGALIPNEDRPWITYPVLYDADTQGYYIDLGGPQRVRICPNQLQDYVLSGKKGNGHKDTSALLPTAQQNVPGIVLSRNSQIVKLPTRIKREMDTLGLAHGDFGKIDYIGLQHQGNGSSQFREFVNIQVSFPGDSQVDRLLHYTYGFLTAFNVNFESFAGCNYLDSAPGNDSVRLRDLWSPNKSAKQGYNVWQACGAREPLANQKVRENYDVAFNAIQILSTVNTGTDTVNLLFGGISPLTDADKRRKDLKIDWLDWDKADR